MIEITLHNKQKAIAIALPDDARSVYYFSETVKIGFITDAGCDKSYRWLPRKYNYEYLGVVITNMKMACFDVKEKWVRINELEPDYGNATRKAFFERAKIEHRLKYKIVLEQKFVRLIKDEFKKQNQSLPKSLAIVLIK